MRYTKRMSNDEYFFMSDRDDTSLGQDENEAANKLGKLEDIEEEIGFERSGSSLIAFLQTPYIKSIMKLYVSARKEFEK